MFLWWHNIKGVQKKIVPFSKFESGLFTRTVCPRRLSFSQFGVLMSTLNCEKENLLGQTVLVKRPLSNFEKGTLFFVHPLFFSWLGNIFFTVDHVLESLDSHGKFWCFFPSHGNQNFLSRTWTFHYFFFQDMVPSPKLSVHTHSCAPNIKIQYY